MPTDGNTWCGTIKSSQQRDAVRGANMVIHGSLVHMTTTYTRIRNLVVLIPHRTGEKELDGVRAQRPLL